MAGRTLISAPIPSIDETARELGVTRKRVRQLTKLMEEIVHGGRRRAMTFGAARKRRAISAKSRGPGRKRAAR